MKHAVCEIRWRSAGEGGRRSPVEAARYMAPAAFGDGPPEWTLVVDRAEAGARAEETAIVHFLVADAPHGRLAPGVTLRLFEGPRPVAEVAVREVYDLNPAAWPGGLAA